MAQGDAKNFNDFVLKVNQGDYADTDTLALAFVSNTYASINSDLTNPQLSNVTVVSGGNVAASYTLTGVTVTRTGAATSWAANNIGTIAKDASNPSPLCAVIYNDTSVNDDLYKVYDLTTDGVTGLDLVNNDFTLTFDGGVLITATNTST